MLVKELLEALKPSQYRGLVKHWNKQRYADIFAQYPHDKKAYRIFLPLSTSSQPTRPNSQVEQYLKNFGYTIEDYKKGLAKKDNRLFRIGKILQHQQTLLQAFANDPVRAGATQQEYFVVISRHPYDIAGMSTDRGWTSCMNLKDGCYREYVPMDIQEGTLVAYLVSKTDKNIQKPLGRILIKPFMSLTDPTSFIFGVEDKVYGTDVEGFRDVVVNWAHEINSKKQLKGVFTLNPKVYEDEMRPYILDYVESDKLDTFRKLLRNPDYILTMSNPSDEEKIFVVTQYPGMISRLTDPSEQVQLAAVQREGTNIKHIENPSERVQMAAVKNEPYALKFITNPSDSVVIAAFKQKPSVLIYVIAPSKQVQMYMVKQDPMNYIWLNYNEIHPEVKAYLKEKGIL